MNMRRTLDFNRNVLIVVSLFLFALLGIAVYFLRKRREDKLKIHQDLLEKEILLHEKELQVKMAEKILDTIASGQLDKTEERRLIDTFEQAQRGLPQKNSHVS